MNRTESTNSQLYVKNLLKMTLILTILANDESYDCERYLNRLCFHYYTQSHSQSTPLFNSFWSKIEGIAVTTEFTAGASANFYLSANPDCQQSTSELIDEPDRAEWTHYSHAPVRRWGSPRCWQRWGHGEVRPSLSPASVTESRRAQIPLFRQPLLWCVCLFRPQYGRDRWKSQRSWCRSEVGSTPFSSAANCWSETSGA